MPENPTEPTDKPTPPFNPVKVPTRPLPGKQVENPPAMELSQGDMSKVPSTWIPAGTVVLFLQAHAKNPDQVRAYLKSVINT